MTDSAEKTELEKKWEAEASTEDAEETSDAPKDAEDDPDPVAELTSERDELRDQLLRARAEFDNYRKRVAREAERTRKMAAESVLRDLLPVVDSIELALNHSDAESGPLAEGVSMVAKQLQDALVKNGLEPIQAQGQPFDPELHDAMLRQPDDSVAPDTVVQEYQKGYKLGDVVLRHAKVVVSTAPESNDDNSDAPDEPAQAEE